MTMHRRENVISPKIIGVAGQRGGAGAVQAPSDDTCGGNVKSPTGRPVLECRQLWKIYGEQADIAFAAMRDGSPRDRAQEETGCVVAVNDVSFTVDDGEVLCIMGLSGSGKSTLIRHLNRLVEPTVGQVLVHGEDIGEKSEENLRRLRAETISMVFQNMALFPHMSVWENVAFGLQVKGLKKKAARPIAEEMLELVHLRGWEDHYPDELSGGMQQRVGIARALATDPDILLLDEPFSALDPLIRRQLQDEFLAISKKVNKTAVFITHDMDEAIRLGDRIAIMKDGRFVQIGTAEEIVLEPNDAYVQEFVKGISTLSFVHAGKVVRPIDSAHSVSSDLPRVNESDTLETVIDVSIRVESDVVVVDPGGHIIGMLSQRDILRAIRGHTIPESS